MKINIKSKYRMKKIMKSRRVKTTRTMNINAMVKKKMKKKEMELWLKQRRWRRLLQINKNLS